MQNHFENLSCEQCDAKCCKYVALEIDRPRCKRDYDQIRWYLRHRDVHVFVDHDGAWCLEFRAVCDSLGRDNRCMKYADRPDVCREHGASDDENECEFLGGEQKPYRVCFDTAEDFELYLEKRGIDWRRKRNLKTPVQVPVVEPV